VRAGKSPSVAVHRGPDGDDGFAVYEAKRSGPGPRATLMVTDFHAARPEAVAGLWRFLLGIDLVEEVCARRRPTDELVEGMLVNWRACRTHALDDDLWLRLVDLPKALDARAYGDGDPLVVGVVDDEDGAARQVPSAVVEVGSGFGDGCGGVRVGLLGVEYFVGAGGEGEDAPAVVVGGCGDRVQGGVFVGVGV
jgi:hypothetical protein